MARCGGAVMASSTAAVGSARRRDTAAVLNVPIVLVLIWLVMEYARPQITLKLPMLTSSALLIWWVSAGKNSWPLQARLGAALLAAMIVAIPMSANGYSAFWSTYTLVINIACVMMGIALSLDNFKRINLVVSCLRLVFLYVGAFAAVHQGMGPAGGDGAQDENYVGMMMAMAIPLTYFPMLRARGFFKKLIFSGMLVVFVTALIVGFSRGAFLGLCAVGLYCIWRSPYRVAALAVVAASVVVASFLLPSGYWKEMKTSADTNEATADLRLQAWAIAFREFKDHPILGVGPGNFIWNMGPYVTEEQIEHIGHPMAGTMVTLSLYFELLADLGLVGVGLVGGICGSTVRDLVKIRGRFRRRGIELERRNRGAAESARDIAAAADGILGSFMAFLVCSAFISTFYMTYLWVWVGLALGLKQSVELLRTDKRSVKAERGPGTPRSVDLRSYRTSPRETGR